MAELINPSSYNDFTLQTLMTPDGITRLNSLLSQLSQNIAGDTESVRVFQGVGTPEASVAAGVGSLYMRTDGGTDTSIYRKESGSADTGWVAVKAPATLPLSVANGGFGADNSAVAQGYIPYMSATGVISWLAVGTSGQYLKTQGAAANPTWSNILSSYAAGSYLIAGPSQIIANGTVGAMTKVIEMYVPRSGTLRIIFGLVQNAPSTSTAQIYRNGSAVGTLRTNATSTWVEYSEDIAGWAIGDLLQIYGDDTGGTDGFITGAVRVYELVPVRENFALGGLGGNAGHLQYSGPSTPYAALGAIGDTYINRGGGATTTLYVKTGATTWTAK